MNPTLPQQPWHTLDAAHTAAQLQTDPLPQSSWRCNVLVPVDFSDHSLAALSFAQALAPDAAIHVLHVYDSPFEGKLRYAGVSQETIDAYRADTRRQAQSGMDELLARNAATQSPLLPALEHGEAESVIAAKAGEYGADLIVNGQARPFVPGGALSGRRDAADSGPRNL